MITPDDIDAVALELRPRSARPAGYCGVYACSLAYLGAVMAHFVVDAGPWRLRDAFPRRFLSARVPYLVRPRGSVDDRSSTEVS